MFSNCTETIKISKKLSWLLRHGAKEAGIKISSGFYNINTFYISQMWFFE